MAGRTRTAVSIILLAAVSWPVAAATTSLSYDVVAAARDTVGNGTYSFNGQTYNAQVSDSNGSLVSTLAQDYSFSAAVSGTNRYFVGFEADNAATVDAAASIGYAVMRAKVYGTGQTDSQIVNVPGQNNVWAAIDGGLIEASTHDVLTFESASLPIGTPIQVEIGLSFHARTGMTGGPADPTAWPGFTQGAPLAQLRFENIRYTIQPWTHPEDTFTETFVIERAVGTTLPLNLFLTVRGGLSALAPLGDVSLGPYTDTRTAGFADATATSRVSVRVLTPGVTYVAESGTPYPTTLAVPEPSSALMLLLGAALTLAATRRRSA